MSDVLTDRQEKVLRFIEKFQMGNGKSPTFREIREHLRVTSDNGILKHLLKLQEKGYITKDDTPRGIALLPSVREKLSTESGIKLPIMGSIPAGGPILTEEYISGWISVDTALAKNATDYFVLQVTGNSMIDAGIFEGDMAIVDRRRQPKNGDIVVALVDNHSTLKRFVKDGSRTYLKAENKDYQDIHPQDELVIQGVVKAIIRQY